MHFENALLEACHSQPILMWLLLAIIPVCLGVMWWSLRKLDTVEERKEDDILTYVLNETLNSDDGTFTFEIKKETE